MRALLVGLIVVATAAFVIGVAIERNSGESHHHESPALTEHAESSGEGATGAEHAELRPLGIDVEAWPFVALAAFVSLALATGAWLRHGAALFLALVVLAMLAFAVLDVREIFHQSDVNENGPQCLQA